MTTRDDPRAEIMRLMREDFDPTPPNWEGRYWDDNAEDVADKIIAVAFAAAIPALEAAERAIDDCHSYRSHLHHKELDQVRAALAAYRGDGK